MNPQELSAWTDEALLEAAKKTKPSPLLDAFFIGFLASVIVYSVAVNSWGFLTLIPLFMIFGLLKKSKKYDALKAELQKRKLPTP